MKIGFVVLLSLKRMFTGRDMQDYLTKTLDWQTEPVANQYDELPLWSSPFGRLLLDHLPLRPYRQYLDIGCGTGFPLIEIAQRIGNGCKAYGLDPWQAAVNRAKQKIQVIGSRQIEVIEGDASDLPFKDNSFDLVTSNLGLNNFDNPLTVLKECVRVMDDGALFCMTSNLNGTFQEFYEIYESALKALGLYSQYKAEFTSHVNHRGTMDSMQKLLNEAGLSIIRQIQSSYTMRFLNGSSFLNHSVTIVGFIQPWRDMFSDGDKELFFTELEKRLNEYSKREGELKLTVPMVYFECRKQSHE